MGGQYRITGDKYPRMRRNRGRRRIVLAVVASVAALGLAGWGTLQLIDVFTGGGDKASAAGTAPGCRTSPSPSASPVKAVPEPGRITVNVLNATARKGLAKATADELKKRGFKIGSVGNATKAYDKKVDGPGIVLGAKAAADAALPVLATQLTGAELKTDTRARAAEVDLILGKGYKALTTKKDADKALTTLARPAPAPSAKKDC
ncbi:LytR C-terminal domain-containing protein [Streptomyces sp. NBC_00414]|uniref:LytR C-terminal domain-containing protein n=1 Tax=Streptomyces sp. NBC_00414 TaxID=2975739 RepID=UPI002E1C28FB